MTCMKCGREISADQVFCDGCLKVMEKYPVKPDTAIQLPKRKEQAAAKKQASRKRQLSPEEMVLHLKKQYKRLVFCLVVAILLLAAAVVVIFLQAKEEPVPLPVGRNYTIDTTQQD